MDIFKLATLPEYVLLLSRTRSMVELPIGNVHRFSHKKNYLQTVRVAIIIILSKMMQELCNNDIQKKYTTGNIIFDEK